MLNIPLMEGNITKDDVHSLIAFLEHTDRFTQGEQVKMFEQEWSRWLGVKYSVFVNSGSSANMITMALLRERYGEGEVIVPAITWSSDIASVFIAGLEPVLLDVRLDTLAMDEADILNHITPRTRAVFLSHILGHNGLSATLLAELKRREIVLIEDVCESHGSEYIDLSGQRRKCGTAGLMSNFSFYYAHHMSTIEGGMICTDDDELYQYLRMFRSHGMLREANDEQFRANNEQKYSSLNPEFLFMVPGFNMRSTELNAVIGLNQLKRLDYNIKRRKENYDLFLRNLNPEIYYTDFAYEGNSNYAFVILLQKQDPVLFNRLTDLLKQEGVEFRRGTSGGGNQARQPFIQKRLPGIEPKCFPNAERLHQFGLYTGNYPGLSQEKILEFCSLLNQLV